VAQRERLVDHLERDLGAVAAAAAREDDLRAGAVAEAAEELKVGEREREAAAAGQRRRQGLLGAPMRDAAARSWSSAACNTVPRRGAHLGARSPAAAACGAGAGGASAIARAAIRHASSDPRSL
jgi:hypothetical protein